jgi:NAD(P)-dependent dehydrogenase (short-subunit alcohol dehydrogenase family)
MTDILQLMVQLVSMVCNAQLRSFRSQNSPPNALKCSQFASDNPCVACDKGNGPDTPGSGYEALIDEVAKAWPKTKVIGYPFNVAKEDETLSMIDDVLNSWGRLDVWVCSSGLLGPPSLEATTPADLQKCFEANSMAPFFALKYAPPAMAKTTPKQAYDNAAPKDQSYGSIIVVSSVASTYGGCWGPCYTMSSHAALGVVRAGVAVLKGEGRILDWR